MTMPYTIQDVRNIILRPHAGQFVIDELPLIFMCMAGLVYGGMEGMPLGGMATVIALFLFLVLLYRFICLRRICYRVGNEQLVCERGLFCRRVVRSGFNRVLSSYPPNPATETSSGILNPLSPKT